MRCPCAGAFRNLSVTEVGRGYIQNEETAVIALPFILVVLAHGLLGGDGLWSVMPSLFFFFFLSFFFFFCTY